MGGNFTWAPKFPVKFLDGQTFVWYHHSMILAERLCTDDQVARELIETEHLISILQLKASRLAENADQDQALGQRGLQQRRRLDALQVPGHQHGCVGPNSGWRGAAPDAR